MRLGSIGGAGPSASVVPTHRSAIESAEDARITIDFPMTPDDIRLRSQTVSRLGRGGLSGGLTGVAMTVLGMLGLSAGGYFCLAATGVDDESGVPRLDPWIGVGIGGGMAAVSTLAVTYGLAQVCLCLKKQHEAGREITTLSTRVQFESPREAAPRDYA
ncbi:hypothetical protein [Pandoraea sputorum]|uniref:Transmembrane protein n=1 Tax=Pandoraea sputorum TaxID=93222 RepID=A0A5E5AS64_9BURK|nr:hypothetical protein [Pandoraea sputorum]VVE76599.1 hypothetical protein PSP31121_00835 [Pandoraea sputorum]